MVSPQHELVERLRADLAADERVRGLWLTGSLATGSDDSFRDVDMLIVVREEDVVAYLEGWPAFAASYRPVLARRLGAVPVFNHVLERWLRWDAVAGVPGVRAVQPPRRALTPSSPSPRGPTPQ